VKSEQAAYEKIGVAGLKDDGWASSFIFPVFLCCIAVKKLSMLLLMQTLRKCREEEN
jgi:hypothetical protein